LGKNQEAVQSYTLALKFAPAVEIYFNLEIVYTRVGDKENAIKSYEQFIKNAPDSLAGPKKDAKRKLRN